MSSTQEKIVVVFGATGVQGGSVAKAILNDPITFQKFKVKAVTRDPAKPAAKALAELGAEVVKADLGDKESLQLVLAGAYAVFLVTTSFETMEASLEEQQGKNVADVAKQLNVKHLIWSSLPNVSKISNKRYTAVAHFDHKAKVDEYIRSLSLPATIVRLGIYSEVLLDFVVPLPTKPLSYGLCFPGTSDWKTALPIIDPTADLGKFIKGILLSPEKTIGQIYNLAEKYYTLEQIASILQQRSLNITPQPLDMQTFKASLEEKGLPKSFQTAMEHLTQYIVEYGFFSGEGIDTALELTNEPLTSLEHSLKTNLRVDQLIEQQMST